MEKELNLDMQSTGKEKKPRAFFKNKLNYGFWTIVLLFALIFIPLNFLKSNSVDENTFVGFFQFFFVLIVLSFFIYKIKNRRYLHSLMVLLILPAVYYITSNFIPFYTFTFTIYNTVGPLSIYLGLDIVFYFFPFGPYQSILVMAANSVNSTEDGYTSRPYSTGVINYSKDDAVNFVKYISNKHFGVAYYYEEKAVLLFRDSFQYLFFLKPDFDRYSYLELNYNGNINVHIGKRDYKKYKDELTYNDLCHSFGSIMKRYFTYYLEGTPKLISKELLKYRHQF